MLSVISFKLQETPDCWGYLILTSRFEEMFSMLILTPCPDACVAFFCLMISLVYIFH